MIDSILAEVVIKALMKQKESAYAQRASTDKSKEDFATARKTFGSLREWLEKMHIDNPCTLIVA